MKHSQAIKLAIAALEREYKSLAVNANLANHYGATTPACLDAARRRREIEQAIALLRPAQPQATGRYNLIYLDPPWKYNSRANHKTRFRGGAEGHYPLMTMEEIAALPLPSLAAKDCAILMWCTFPYIDEQIRLFEHWGFTFRTQALTWIKLNPKGYDLPADDPN